MHTVNISTATADDLPAMADLLAGLFALEHDFAPDRDRQIAGLQLILEDPAIGQLFVARIDGGVAGMINALITVSTALGRHVLLLEDIVVTDACRRRGVGRALVEAACAWGAARGYGRATLLVDHDNGPALAFYAALGFEASAMQVRRRMLAP